MVLNKVRSGFFGLALCLCLVQTANSSSVAISLETTEAPAVDLVYQDQIVDRDQAIDLSKQGVDLSQLDPVPSLIWKPQTRFPVNQDTSDYQYPDAGETVQFDSNLPSSQGLFRSRVSIEVPGGVRLFQLLMGLNGHAALARNALLRQLGYPIPIPRYYRSLTVKFKDDSKRNVFLDSLSDGTLTSRSRWVQKLGNHSEVTLQDVVLEPAQIDLPMYHWGVIPASHLKGRRAVRALIIPLVLLEIPESINLYSYELGKVMNRAAVLTYPYADSFEETSVEDARWIARKIAQLTRKDLESIVQAAMYPSDISALIVERLIGRRNQMVQLFDLAPTLEKEHIALPFNTKLTMGHVKNGKLTLGNYPGYAARFSYGDPDSPLRKSEVGRYLFIESISSGLSFLTKSVNEYLQVQSVNDVARNHQAEEMQKFADWARQNPGVPYSRAVDSWGGPFGGVAIRASRDVVSGTYYGSDATIQLVDNVGVSASIGYFGQLSNVPVVIPTIIGNVMVQRNYLHVRPITEMKTALKTDWKTLWVPHFINQLAKLLDDKNSKDGTELAATGDSSSENSALRPFLDFLKDGEMIVITDTLAGSVRGRVDIPIPFLLNPALMQFNPTIGVGAGTSPTILRRTTLLRTTDGIQVYLQNARVLDYDIEFNFNWWLNILKLNHQNKWGVGKTKAFLLDQEPNRKVDDSKWMAAMRGLLKQNDSEILEETFKDYEIKHDIQVSIDRGKFLWWRGYKLEEEHHVRATPPREPEIERTLYSNRFVLNQGLDGYSFFSDIVTALTRSMIALPPAAGLNPANAFLGSAKWVSVTTEAEVTPTYKRDPVCTVEHHWGGWLLSKQSLMKILDLLEEKVKPLNLDKPLIRREEFATTGSLQMYQIFSALVVYQSGMERLAATLLKPSVSTVIKDLIAIEGKDSLEKWCRNPNRQFGDKVFSVNSYSGYENGHTINYKCLKPWMNKALKIRDEVLAHKYPDTGEGEVKWKTRLVRKLEHYMELPKFLNWVGKENYFFQIKVSGFRTEDENGDNPYISDSLGSFHEKEGTGVFRDFSLKYGISASELYARYLSEGYSGGN